MWDEYRRAIKRGGWKDWRMEGLEMEDRRMYSFMVEITFSFIDKLGSRFLLLKVLRHIYLLVRHTGIGSVQ